MGIVYLCGQRKCEFLVDPAERLDDVFLHRKAQSFGITVSTLPSAIYPQCPWVTTSSIHRCSGHFIVLWILQACCQLWGLGSCCSLHLECSFLHCIILFYLLTPCMYLNMCKQMLFFFFAFVCTRRGQIRPKVSSLHSTLFSVTGTLTEPRPHQFACTDRQVQPFASVQLHPSGLGLQAWAAMPGFYMDAGVWS